jgi:hypothetical protein
VIIDGMDQMKLLIPKMLNQAKAYASAWRLKTHLTGNYDFSFFAGIFWALPWVFIRVNSIVCKDEDLGLDIYNFVQYTQGAFAEQKTFYKAMINLYF